MSFFGLGRRNQGTNNSSIPGYANFKTNVRTYVNSYYNANRGNNISINKLNKFITGSLHRFLNANPRQAARAGNAAGAAAAAGASQNAQTTVANEVITTPPGTPVPVIANNAAAAALRAGATVPQAAAAATGAAASTNNAKNALKAINWSSMNNAGRNTAINKLLGQYANKWNTVSNNGLNNYQRSILVTIKTKRPPALPPKTVAAPVPSLMNAPIPGEGPRNVAPSPNSPFRSLNKKMANGQPVWAPSANSQNYYAKKNNSTNNYYKVVQSAGGSYIYSQAPNNKNKPFIWSKNAKKFDPKFSGGFGSLALQALANARAAPPAPRRNNGPKN